MKWLLVLKFTFSRLGKEFYGKVYAVWFFSDFVWDFFKLKYSSIVVVDFS